MANRVKECPFYRKSCKETNEELQKDNKICELLVKMQSPGKPTTFACAIEANVIMTNGIVNLLNQMAGQQASAPVIYLPNQPN